jgi:hypothetical protein
MDPFVKKYGADAELIIQPVGLSDNLLRDERVAPGVVEVGF